MKIGRKFRNGKRSKPQKGILLVFLLMIILFFWFKTEDFITSLF
ncbi:MAG: Uncharacterised protein [Polaribacter sp. SA4-10]|nr:MAG: Uncharacterised protein [Polaribacter sp. SA4-10]